MENIFVLSWSNGQQCFHIERIADMLKANLDAFKNGYPVDFIVLAFADSFEAINTKRKEFEDYKK